jgi:hypothetical protein
MSLPYGVSEEIDGGRHGRCVVVWRRTRFGWDALKLDGKGRVVNATNYGYDEPPTEEQKQHALAELCGHKAKLRAPSARRAKKASKPRAKRSRKWIQKAIKPSKKGALHKALHVPAGKKIPLKTLRAAARKKGVTGKRARLALTMRGFKHSKKRKAKR